MDADAQAVAEAVQQRAVSWPLHAVDLVWADLAQLGGRLHTRKPTFGMAIGSVSGFTIVE